MNLLNLTYGLIDDLRDSHLIKDVQNLYDHRSHSTEISIIPSNYDEETIEEIECLFSELLCTYDLKYTDYIIK